MKMKVFNFIGSHQKNSFTKQVVYELNQKLEELYGNEYEKTYIDRFNSYIQMCNGCKQCFKIGNCPLDNDSMKKIREEMFSSDIIVIATPVYINSVSSFTKLFFERLSAYIHLMWLAGKVGIIVLTLENSGAQTATNYIINVLTFMGINVKKVILVKHKEYYSQQIIDTIETFKRINKENYIYLENDRLKTIYSKCNYLFNNIVISPYEKKWWNHFQSYSFTEYKEYLLKMETMNFNIDNEKERGKR